MDTSIITPERLASSVIAVPPLARDANMRICREQNTRLVRYLEQGGITTLLYGGNAILYHVRAAEYAQFLSLLQDIADEQILMVPSVGPAFGTMMDQAEVLADFDFPTVMILPQKEIADTVGIARGIRLFAEAYGKPIVVYLKHDRWLPAEVVGQLYRDGLISWIKYAVVRSDTSDDRYLREVLDEVPGKLVVSGIGEQPAIIHLRDFGIGCFTSGCVCVAPSRSMEMLRAIQAGDYETAELIRVQFKPLEDLRNEIQPIRVLHRAIDLAGISASGPIVPMLGELTASDEARVQEAAEQLYAWERGVLSGE